MTQPAPRRALVDLDNIEFYRPQPSKSLQPEPTLSVQPISPCLSFLPAPDKGPIPLAPSEGQRRVKGVKSLPVLMVICAHHLRTYRSRVIP
ncbi:uncharacterized protein BO96DRAFT_186688 [Aspergillus niger CBS 101883]|uniref:uncharacterized protein n=1 Tax=Aspergillus lacticoffeatus (strain CBS 101883) TaxID=1450533 RepID=UPI000D7EBCA3|nr:uncharacterized protein BO96DRAFT_186688 [Aspergillus niger CBS 101883]PYH60290.1 hypothetical protein BO96DRAFT_186688 [Aspergillus niger CBS 101883]